MEVCLDEHAWELIVWWVNNLHLQSKSLLSSSTELEVHTDASFTGWGFKLVAAITGGHYDIAELDHITCLESCFNGSSIFMQRFSRHPYWIKS